MVKRGANPLDTITMGNVRMSQGNLVKEISGQRLIFFGVHGDSAADQQLAAGVMEKISTQIGGKAAIGLEQARRK